MSDPKDALLTGVHILDPVFSPNGFHFEFREEGKGSGGTFAWGEFVRDDRRLELHFRYSLGLIPYHVAQQHASHESYMHELGVRDQCQYPGFSDDAISPFRGLVHDLGFAEDFLSGSATVLRRAAKKQAQCIDDGDKELMAHAVGDVRLIEQLRVLFYERKYRDIVNLASQVKYPN